MPQTEVRVFRDADESIPFLVWLDDLRRRDPTAYVKCLQRVELLSQLGNELRRPIADMLRDGVYELRAKRGRVNYRILYFFHGSNVVVISHGTTKEKGVPATEIEKVIRRMSLVQRDAAKHTTEWRE